MAGFCSFGFGNLGIFKYLQMHTHNINQCNSVIINLYKSLIHDTLTKELFRSTVAIKILPIFVNFSSAVSTCNFLLAIGIFQHLSFNLEGHKNCDPPSQTQPTFHKPTFHKYAIFRGGFTVLLYMKSCPQLCHISIDLYSVRQLSLITITVVS